MSKQARYRKKCKRRFKTHDWWDKHAPISGRTIDITTMCTYFTYLQRSDPLFTRKQFKEESRRGPVPPVKFKLLQSNVGPPDPQWLLDKFKLPEHVIESLRMKGPNEVELVVSRYERLKL